MMEYRMETHEKLQLYAKNMPEKAPKKKPGENVQENQKISPQSKRKVVPFLAAENERITALVDCLKPLGIRKRIFFESEITETFESRCQWGSILEHQHRHDYIEAFYLLRGEARHFVGNQSYRVMEGEFWILNTSVTHSIVLKDADSLIMNILISRRSYEKLVAQMGDLRNPMYHFFMNELYGEEKRPEFLRYRVEKHLAAEEELYRILREVEENRPYGQQMIENRLANVLLELSGLKLMDVPQEPQRQGLDLFCILKYISEKNQSVSLEELSRVFYYSQTHISNFLRKQTGLNFRNLVCKMKLEKARELLANTDWSIEQISDTMNYSSRKHFERSYQGMFHQTPCQYRKALEKSR